MRANASPHATFCLALPSAPSASAGRFSPTIAPSACEATGRRASDAPRGDSGRRTAQRALTATAYPHPALLPGADTHRSSATAYSHRAPAATATPPAAAAAAATHPCCCSCDAPLLLLLLLLLTPLSTLTPPLGRGGRVAALAGAAPSLAGALAAAAVPLTLAAAALAAECKAPSAPPSLITRPCQRHAFGQTNAMQAAERHPPSDRWWARTPFPLLLAAAFLEPSLSQMFLPLAASSSSFCDKATDRAQKPRSIAICCTSRQLGDRALARFRSCRALARRTYLRLHLGGERQALSLVKLELHLHPRERETLQLGAAPCAGEGGGAQR